MRQKMRETTLFGLYFYGLEPLFSRKILRFNIGQKLAVLARKPSFFITFFERVFGRGKLFPKKIGDKCSTGNIVFPENLAFCGLFSWRILQKFLCPYFTSFSRKNQYFFYFPSGSYRNAPWCFLSEIFYPLFWIFLFDLFRLRWFLATNSLLMFYFPYSICSMLSAGSVLSLPCFKRY